MGSSFAAQLFGVPASLRGNNAGTKIESQISVRKDYSQHKTVRKLLQQQQQHEHVG